MQAPEIRTWLRNRFIRRAALALAGLIPLLYLGISLLSAHFLTQSSNRPPRLDPHIVGPDATAWSTRTADGLTLRGWYYPTRQHRRLIVLVHGLWGGWEDLAPVGYQLRLRGYDVLLFDLRGHGGSDPARLSMGRRERNDLRAVLAWAERRGFSPDQIGWLGHSMGASTVLMEAARNPDIRVAVLDSPYGNLPELLDSQLSQHSHLPKVFNPAILFAAHRAFGLRSDDLIPIRFARSWGERPLLLIHGDADSTVPVRQAHLLAQAAGPACRKVILPGVEHVEAYRAYPAAYIAAVDGFFARHLKDRSETQISSAARVVPPANRTH